MTDTPIDRVARATPPSVARRVRGLSDPSSCFGVKNRSVKPVCCIQQTIVTVHGIRMAFAGR